MIKAVLVQFLLIFLFASVGLSQGISYDSIRNYYQYEIKSDISGEITNKKLAKEINEISIKQISDFSDF